METLIAFVLIAFAGIAKAFQDGCKNNLFPKQWTWMNERTGWRNKYKWEKPTSGEIEFMVGPAFPGATTFLVWITDGWHFFQMLFLWSFAYGNYLLELRWYWVIITGIAMRVIFEVTYTIIKHYDAKRQD